MHPLVKEIALLSKCKKIALPLPRLIGLVLKLITIMILYELFFKKSFSCLTFEDFYKSIIIL